MFWSCHMGRWMFGQAKYSALQKQSSLTENTSDDFAQMFRICVLKCNCKVPSYAVFIWMKPPCLDWLRDRSCQLRLAILVNVIKCGNCYFIFAVCTSSRLCKPTKVFMLLSSVLSTMSLGVVKCAILIKLAFKHGIDSLLESA